jgi:hypothetical protein
MRVCGRGGIGPHTEAQTIKLVMAQGDHFSEAERLSRDAHAPGLAQVHATLAVVEQLARVAEALDILIQLRQEDG